MTNRPDPQRKQNSGWFKTRLLKRVSEIDGKNTPNEAICARTARSLRVPLHRRQANKFEEKLQGAESPPIFHAAQDAVRNYFQYFESGGMY